MNMRYKGKYQQMSTNVIKSVNGLYNILGPLTTASGLRGCRIVVSTTA